LVNISEKLIFKNIFNENNNKITQFETTQIICEIYEIIKKINENNENNFCKYEELNEIKKLILRDNFIEIINFNRKIQNILFKQWGSKYKLIQFFLGINYVKNEYKQLLEIFNYS
jgi:hypothetical protein